MRRVAVARRLAGVARSSADWSALQARAEVEFFTTPFAERGRRRARAGRLRHRAGHARAHAVPAVAGGRGCRG